MHHYSYILMAAPDIPSSFRPLMKDAATQSTPEATELIGAIPSMVKECPTTFLPESLPPLLSLPQELFDLVADHLLPIDARLEENYCPYGRHPTYNHYKLFEFGERFKGKWITRDVMDLALTSKPAFQRCVDTFAARNKSMRLYVGRKYDYYDKKLTWDDRLELMCQQLKSPFGRRSEYAPYRSPARSI